MSSIPRLTLLEVLQFLAEPLNCDTSLLARELLRALAARGRARPAIPFLNAVCRASCEWRIRPALLISLTAAIFISLVLTLRNACVTLVRWYTAARGSAFVAVATRALRELHASDAAAATAAASGLLRPAAVHRWYFPQSVTAPVVCCGCFQPVLVAQDAEGRAQCCELCGVVAHGACLKSVPHNCRLLSLAAAPPQQAEPAAATSPPPPPLPPLPHDWRPAGTTLDLILPPADAEMLLTGADTITNGGGGGGGANGWLSNAAAAHGPSSLCLYCGEPCEVGLLAVEPVWRCGGCRRFVHVQCWSSVHPGVLSAATRAALEGQSMEVEEITGSPRGGVPFQRDAAAGSGRAEHASGGSGGGGGGGSTGSCSTGRADGNIALGDQRADGAVGVRLRGVGTAAAASSGTALTAATAAPASLKSGCGSGGGGGGDAPADHTRLHRPSARSLHPTGPSSIAAAAAGTTACGAVTHKPPPLDSRTKAAAAAPGAAGWDRHRRCQSLPNIAGQSGGNRNGGGCGGDGGGGATSMHPGQGGGGGGGEVGPTLTPSGGPGGGSTDGTGMTRGSTGPAATTAAASGAVRYSNDFGRLSRLDCCDPLTSLGPLGAMVVPPTAVLPVNGGRTTFLASRSGKTGTTSTATAPPAPSATAGSTAATAIPGGAAAATGAGGVGGGSGGRGRKKQQKQQQQQKQTQLGRSLRQQAQLWYRSHTAGWSLTAAADAAAADRWRNFRIGSLPTGYKPLLVFINPRSGPQAGEHLRQQLLQLLHPMQVVDLVREAPGAALRCWWGVPGLRVLVVGGDGTAGWILGELEVVAAEGAAAAAAAQQSSGGNENAEGNGEPGDTSQGTAVTAAAAAPPAAPPVAVLPLGTGNDLARVLGWGGGLAALDARGGVAMVLAEVATAAPTPLDRWALTITTTPPEPVKRRSSFLSRRRQAIAAAAAARAPPPPPVVQVKTFNNYLGIGIDSWCALEFHRMRERYPGWFKSQLGNKMWYTGVGARDLLARSCVALPYRLQLECDGSVVELPPSTQGILLLNIPSYMGGVDLWGNGVSQQQQQQLMLAAAAAAAGGSGGGGNNGGSSGGGGGGAESSSPERYIGNALGTSAAASGTATRRGGGGPTAAIARVPTDLTIPAPPPSLQPPLQLHPEVSQSISDGVLEVVVVYGAVHLGQLQVGLARATKLCQCRTAIITTYQALPMQVDGEPWMQPAAQLTVSLKGSVVLLRRLDLSSAASRLTAAVGEVLDGAVVRGTITAVQRQLLGAQIAQRLGAPHAV
ncbi:hypothetical protein Vretimale_14954 [Volvox reticuliferus]|nr:hypothetical protein Vretimale_14954 [Volvox reticuliferus]